jgi:pilus assembly protein CpaF
MTLPNVEDQNVKSEGTDFLHQVRAVHEQLLDGLDYTEIDRLQSDPMVLKLYLLQEIERLILKKNILQKSEISTHLLEAVFDEVLGFGPIEPLLRDETITDIFINSPTTTYIERKGRVEKANIRFIDNEHIFRLVQRVAAKSGRHLDLSTPYFDAQLPDGTRIHAIIPPIAIDGIKVSLRKYSFQKFHIGSLINGGCLTDTMARFLQIGVEARFNIAICGGTGSGKTTLLNSLLASLGKRERIITIEDTPELESPHHHTVRLLTRIANPEGKGAVTQADLMINALRMRPDRVILGELRGSEAFNLLHAMNTGQDGSMVTLHASGAEEVISRLLNMILMARYSLSSESVRQQIAGALDLIVYVARLVDGSRRVMTISQVSGDENGDLVIEDVFRYNIEKINQDELIGSFQQFDIAPTTRNRNKLITSGLLKEYESLFKKEESDGDKQI